MHLVAERLFFRRWRSGFKRASRTTVRAPNFPPRGNFALFFWTSLLTSERVLQKINENESMRNRLDLHNWFNSYLWLNQPEGATDLARKFRKFPWGGKLGAFTVSIGTNVASINSSTLFSVFTSLVYGSYGPVGNVVNDGLPQLPPQVASLAAHVLDRPAQVVAGLLAPNVRHVLAQQVLQSLTNGVALGHYPLAALVPGARRVGHQGCPADDGLQAFFQARAGPHFVVRHRVKDDSVLGHRTRALVSYFAHR